jgi:hypothetical protein
VHTAFAIAARRKFAAGWTRAEVVRYVARVRALLSERPGLLDPRAAEDELFTALGGARRGAGFEAGAVAAARLFLLDALTASLDLDDAGIDDLLEQARDAANRMLAAMTA